MSTPRPTYWPFRKARKFVHGLDLSHTNEWRAYCRGELKETKGLKPSEIPVRPDTVYPWNTFTTWGDWLGTGTVSISKREFRKYSQARSFSRKLGLQRRKQWEEYCMGRIDGMVKPEDIPSRPDRAYPEEFVSWADWLRSPEHAPRSDRNYRTFAQARAWARTQHLERKEDWIALCAGNLEGMSALPEDIPSQPQTAYKDLWKNWADWLGHGKRKGKEDNFHTYEQAQEYVQALNFEGKNEFLEWVAGRMPGEKTRPVFMPATPYRIYKDCGWNGWPDFLGYKRRRRKKSEE